jgi:hypothetical protein
MTQDAAPADTDTATVDAAPADTTATHVSDPATDKSPANGSFDDDKDLDQFVRDTRSADKKIISSPDDANIVVDRFASNTDAAAWSSLDRADVAARLKELIADPRRVYQDGLNLCGPAAFYQLALGRDPVTVARFVADLFDQGRATMGLLTVTPDNDLLAADYAKLNANGNAASQCEWMMLGALRNSTNVFWQGSWQGDPNQTLAAMTRPEEISDWMTKSGIWSDVKDGGKWASNPGIPNAANLDVSEGHDVALLIHINLIAKSEHTLGDPIPGLRIENDVLMTQFPNHWVVLLSEVTPDVTQTHVSLTIWTWGGIIRLTAENQVFLDNYFGAISARV